jgi:hypothetical protein
VTQDQDLEIFGSAGPGDEGKPASDAAEHEAEHLAFVRGLEPNKTTAGREASRHKYQDISADEGE